MVSFGGDVASAKGGPLRNPEAGNRPLFGCFAEINKGPLHRERERVSAATFARRRVLIDKATDRLVFGPPLTPKTEARRLQQRYREHRDSLYVFLERSDVEPTNNGSERDLRNSVIHRKVTGGHRSAWGAEASAIFTTLLTTARKRGDNLLDALHAVASPSPLHVAGMAT